MRYRCARPRFLETLSLEFGDRAGNVAVSVRRATVRGPCRLRASIDVFRHQTLPRPRGRRRLEFRNLRVARPCIKRLSPQSINTLYSYEYYDSSKRRTVVRSAFAVALRKVKRLGRTVRGVSLRSAVGAASVSDTISRPLRGKRSSVERAAASAGVRWLADRSADGPGVRLSRVPQSLGLALLARHRKPP